MKILRNLLENVEYTLVQGSLDVEINDIKDNSRAVTTNDLFLAVVGTVVDSHKYIKNAINQGAKVIVIERDVIIEEDVTVIRVNSSRKALSYMSMAYFDYPAKKLTTIAITGTCGKTSTSYIIKGILEENGQKLGIIGTIGALVDGKLYETHNTTPNPYEIQSLFAKMVQAGCTYCVMEVSSQGLKMDRVLGVEFDYGIFTNLSPDHIGENEHADYEEYRYCKSLLFKQCKKGILNIDSADYPHIIKDHTCEIITFSVENPSDVQAQNLKYIIEESFFGMSFGTKGKLNESFILAIPGKFSVYNALCGITLANELGINPEVTKKALKKAAVKGRMEVVISNEKYKLIIDYAHNNEEIESLMDTISNYKPNRLVCIFGCGGNRAKARRYDMGEVCGKWADLNIITEDNPRFEEFESINEDIFVGINRANGKYVVIKDRKSAIKYSLENAEDGDIILLIGKGHENYQEINGIYHPWDERKAVLDSYNEIKEI